MKAARTEAAMSEALRSEKERELIKQWEAKGIKFTRVNGSLLRDGNGEYHIRWYMITSKGVGLAVGYQPFNRTTGKLDDTPWEVQYKGKSIWFAEDQVKPATALQYFIRPSGFGGTAWIFMAILAAITAWAIYIGQGWWTLIAWVPLLGSTFAGWKRWFK